jgi:hypothetical protein
MAEKIGIQIFADTTKADKAIDKLAGKLGKLNGVSKKAVDGIAKISKAALAAKAAITGMALVSANAEAENQKLARQAKTTVEEFKALDFAVTRFGSSGEQLADNFKDLSDRLGEYATAGTGAWQDFADVMGMSKQQARETAKEFQHLAGPEVVQRMVTEMENAGATASQMTFVLESMGNDLSLLAPLFRDNGKELGEMTKRFKAANDQLKITNVQQQGLKELDTTFDLMTKTMGNAVTAISATIAPTLNSFFGSVIEVVPKATQVIIDFFNTWVDAGNLSSIKAAEDRLEDVTEKIENLQKQTRTGQMGRGLRDELRRSKEEAEKLKARIVELQEEQKKLDDAKKITGGTIGTTGVGHEKEQDWLDKKLERDRIYGQRLLDQKARQFEEQKALEEKFEEASRVAQERNNNRALVAEYEMNDSRIATFGQANDAMMTALRATGQEQSGIYKTLFEINKAAAVANIAVNTAQGVSEALKLAPPMSYALAGTTAIKGAAELATVQATSIGGARSGGGVVQGGTAYRAGELEPEVFTDREGRATLIAPAGGGHVSPLRDLPSFSAKMNVNVINKFGGEANVRTSMRSDTDMDVIIERAVRASEQRFAESMNSGYGAYAESMRSTHSMERRF